MKKKVFLSILLSLVLYTLLSLSSISLCKEVTAEDIANAIYNIANARGVTLTKGNIDINTCTTIANSFNSNQGHYLICNGGSGYENYIYFYLLKGKNYYVSGTVYAASSTEKIEYSISNKYFIQTSFAIANPNKLGNYSYNDGDIYSSYNGNTISFSAGTIRPTNFDIFADTLYVNNYFAFNYISGLNDVSIEEFNTIKQISSNYNTQDYVAEFGKYINLDTTTYKPTYTVYKYEKIQNYFEPIIVYDYYRYTYVNDDLGRIYLNSNMLIPNTIIEIDLKPIDIDEFDILSMLFYITDSNTIITNGDLDIDNTFNDDYYNKYNNLINNLVNQNVGKITDNSGDVTGNIDYTPIIENQTSLFDKAFSISGEKIDEIFEEAKSKIHIESGEIAEFEIIKNYLEGQPGDFIISWQRKPTHISIGGTQLEDQLYFDSSSEELGNNQINFSQIERDNPDLHEALTWSRTIIAFALYSLLIHEGYILLLSTLGVGVGIYGTKQEEKAILKRQQEEKEEKQRKQEQRWTDQLERQKYRDWLYKNRKR